MINLNATECVSDILLALPERLVVVDIAAHELEEGRKKGRRNSELLAELVGAGVMEIDGLGTSGEAIFEQLVAGPAISTLDDGEAATIAYAVEHSIDLVVDDGKARRICKEQFPDRTLRCSVELFQHPSIESALGTARFAVAVLNALQKARMRVLPEHVGWIVSVIGQDNASACRSLPRGRYAA